MKKLLVFALLMTLVSTLTVAVSGCGKKTTSTAGGTVSSTSPATVTTKVEK